MKFLGVSLRFSMGVFAQHDSHMASYAKHTTPPVREQARSVIVRSYQFWDRPAKERGTRVKQRGAGALLVQDSLIEIAELPDFIRRCDTVLHDDRFSV